MRSLLPLSISLNLPKILIYLLTFETILFTKVQAGYTCKIQEGYQFEYEKIDSYLDCDYEKAWPTELFCNDVCGTANFAEYSCTSIGISKCIEDYSAVQSESGDASGILYSSPAGKKIIGNQPINWKAIARMVAEVIVNSPSSAGLQPVNESKKEVVKKLMKYGCHCFTGSLTATVYKGGKGKPVNALDDICRQHNWCRQCVEVDPECSDQISSKNITPYNVIFDTESNIICKNSAEDTISGSEANNSGSNCGVKLCQCDKKFSENLRDLWRSKTFVYDASFWSDARNNLIDINFKNNRSDYCDVGSTGNRVDSCCGTFPNLRPYSSVTNDCCDGHVKMIGEC